MFWSLSGADEGQLVVVASQVWGYGVWDGGVAQSGTLLASWEGPAPSLLFLWVSNAQANLLHRELSAIRTLGGATGDQESERREGGGAAWELGLQILSEMFVHHRDGSPALSLRAFLLHPPAGSEGAAAGAPGRPAGLHPGAAELPAGPLLPWGAGLPPGLGRRADAGAQLSLSGGPAPPPSAGTLGGELLLQHHQ